MGAWNTKINSSDAFLDIYQNFFERYNRGESPSDVSTWILDEYSDMFNDYDEGHNSLFGLALAQWETASLDSSIFHKVKCIIDDDKDILLWKEQGVSESILRKRSEVLNKFLSQISVEKLKPKRRFFPKDIFTTHELVNIAAPDGLKSFTVSEEYTNGVYNQTGSFLNWGNGGSSVFYYVMKGKGVNARWLDRQSLEIRHAVDIAFTKKNETAFFCGDRIKIVYKIG